MNSDILGVVISVKEYDEYLELKKKNTPIKKICGIIKRCPMCNYTVDKAVPKQNYCDRCGQKL